MLGQDRHENLWEDGLILYAVQAVPADWSIHEVTHCDLPDARLSTIVNCLLDYVRRFTKIVSGLPGEINHLCAECLSDITTSITRELLSIINFCQDLNPVHDGLYQRIKVSVAHDNVAGVNRTKTFRTLFEHNVRLLFANCRKSQFSPEMSLIAFELLESLFQQKLVLSKRPLHFVRLGQSYEDKEDDDAAETCYRLAIKLCVDSKDYIFEAFRRYEGSDLLKCRQYFGEFLRKMKLDDEALIMLIRAFTTCVSDCMLLIPS
ncbi:hypothetical protein NA56DRAFT_15898 [Hyaloscypha hepaticicola]|uniref:Uncharacterized protein n=1 Tax=Hyaloscypha hepaticicola TaxID=2082293 RepID=A0A2J6QQG9_9HELO|nr:hypothetical protein NA56DRAFT_15898 [Hyaloscypha hepaticicola]